MDQKRPWVFLFAINAREQYARALGCFFLELTPQGLNNQKSARVTVHGKRTRLGGDSSKLIETEQLFLVCERPHTHALFQLFVTEKIYQTMLMKLFHAYVVNRMLPQWGSGPLKAI